MYTIFCQILEKPQKLPEKSPNVQKVYCVASLVPPQVQQLAEHGVGPALLLLPQSAVHGQLLVGHSHVLIDVMEVSQ